MLVKTQAWPWTEVATAIHGWWSTLMTTGALFTAIKGHVAGPRRKIILYDAMDECFFMADSCDTMYMHYPEERV